MAYCFIISSNIDFVDSTYKFVEKCSYFKPVKILLRDTVYTRWIESYKCISEKIAAIPFADLRESVVLVDEYFNIQESKLIEYNVNSNVFWARMILSFPELEFLFLNKSVEDSSSIMEWIENETKHDEILVDEYQIVQIKKKAAFLSLFDFSGLRSAIRSTINTCSNKSNKKNDSQIDEERYLSIRKKKARVIEDELSYAFFHGYIVFKRNYLCKLYTKLNHLVQGCEENKEVELQIQDLSLGFVDKREDIHLLDMAERYKKFSFLKIIDDEGKMINDDRDFVITTGQEHIKVEAKYIYINKIKKTLKIIGLLPGKNSILVGEKRYFIWLNDNKNTVKECDYCELKSHDLNYKVEQIYKPTKGMFDIEKKLHLKSETSSVSKNKKKLRLKSESSTASKNNSHSAPGVLALIAENLIARAQQILDNTKQVADAIHAATLALEAKELLNGLTPTLAFQAFTLQQKAEVMAECLFVGSEYNIKLDTRFIEIENEVEFIAQRFAESERNRAQLNVQLKIVETLSGVYGNYKQFEEELECLNKARSLNFKKLKWKIFVPFLLLLSWAMNRLSNFGSLLLWMQVFFAFFYYLFLKSYQETWVWAISWQGVSLEVKTLVESLLSSVKYFFTAETSDTFGVVFKDHELLSNIIRGFQGFCSLSSLSIFMAMIYLRFSRK